MKKRNVKEEEGYEGGDNIILRNEENIILI